ncbi:hypothetical protein C1645_734906 [Glomus cerebriforme]|uniref:Uncharacterized protein n=1 Tax=Glomus cerebriforme TaxID=658196 RepID=A0A397TBD4_9GLOM|nr:hypothetical protein C1645_734906 [Glomus cerebriforme]
MIIYSDSLINQRKRKDQKKISFLGDLCYFIDRPFLYLKKKLKVKVVKEALNGGGLQVVEVKVRTVFHLPEWRRIFEKSRSVHGKWFGQGSMNDTNSSGWCSVRDLRTIPNNRTRLDGCNCDELVCEGSVSDQAADFGSRFDQDVWMIPKLSGRTYLRLIGKFCQGLGKFGRNPFFSSFRFDLKYMDNSEVVSDYPDGSVRLSG